MTDKELLAAIRKVVRSRPNADSVTAADLARYDAIVGLLRREENGVETKHLATQSEQPRSDAPRLSLADSDTPQ